MHIDRDNPICTVELVPLRVRKQLVYFFAFLIILCGTAAAETLVLDYKDFGPQAMAWDTIGMEWWQWDSAGDPDPEYRYNIRVVVYRHLSLAETKTLFPVDQAKQQDYRYLEYDQAIAYLDKHIKEDAISNVTERLKGTKKKLVAAFDH